VAAQRAPIPKETETAVLLLSRRRCAFCFGLDSDVTQKNGQLAHINRRPNDNRQENLAFLCLPHHDEYDTTRSQSKGLTPGELRKYVATLYAYFDSQVTPKPERSDDLFAEYRNLVQPRWRYIYEKALNLATGPHRTLESVLMTLESPKTIAEISRHLIPPDNLEWSTAIVEGAVAEGYLVESKNTPGLYEATPLTRVLMEALEEIPDAVKDAAGRKVWEPSDWLPPSKTR
jgi:hypothetical protein